MKILSLDQATNLTGFAVFEDEELTKYGVLDIHDIDRGKTLPTTSDEKSVNVKEFLKRMINTYKIELVVMEDIQMQKNVKSYKHLAHLQGILKNYLYENEISYGFLSPSEWRSTLGIKGRDRKTQKKNAQEYILKKYEFEATEDEADAICLGLASIKRLNKDKLVIIKDI